MDGILGLGEKMSLPKPYYQDDAVTIYHGDCREILPRIEPVDLVLTDPPYFSVVDAEWDNAWDSPAEFLSDCACWLGLLAPLLKSNASLYWFASPSMASRIEMLISEKLRVLSHIVWRKASGGKLYRSTIERMDKTTLRAFAPETERIIFAERYGSDDWAMGEAGYNTKCEAAKKTVFGDYLRAEMEAAKISVKEVAALFPSKSGGLTGCVSNWLLGLNCPTSEQYMAIRERLNRSGNEFLRREYEDLRREYEDLRRPMNLSASVPYTDLWEFAPPLGDARFGHPCQKPTSLFGHIISASSKPMSTTLDPFMGSGTTLRAAKDLGRKAIGIELEEKYCEIAAMRMSQEVLAL
jgi:adenine-specific DNA-methyltransferase